MSRFIRVPAVAVCVSVVFAWVTTLFIVPFTVAADELKVVDVTVKADSEDVGYEAYKAMDGDLKTLWHTQFRGNSPNPPHEICVDLQEPRTLKGFVLTPRQDMPNGNFTKYAVYLDDDARGNAIFESTLDKPAAGQPQAAQTVLFETPRTGRYFRLRTLDEAGNRPYASLSELELLADGLRFRGKPIEPGAALAELPGDAELKSQYIALMREIKLRSQREKYADQVFEPNAMVFQDDRDPVDIVWRRTRALWNDLKNDVEDKRRQEWAGQIDRLAEKVKTVAPITDPNTADQAALAERFALYLEICRLRREIAFANPLLDGLQELLFVKRHRATFNHMCDQYYGINSVPGGGIYVLSEPFGNEPQVRDLLKDSVAASGRLQGQKLSGGAFVTPSLSYDAQKLAFAYVECQGDKQHRFHTDVTRGHWDERDAHHLFTVNIDGSDLRQVTDGTWNDFDPCWLPNGRLAFISERRGGYLRCGRVCPNFTLFDMDPDGGRMRCLSYHETNEWNPTVTHDGRILYTRWDYVDRHGCTAHHPWITTLDGRNSRAVHGNFALRHVRPDMELGCQPIPDSPKFIATAAPHHGQMFGSLVIVDPRVEDDNVMSPVKRITPDIDFPEVQGGAQVYGTPWPLSEKYYLAVADFAMRPDQGREGQPYLRGDYGIYLVDAFGNKELLYRDPNIASISPVPLRPRSKPVVLSPVTETEIKHQPYVLPRGGDEATATILITNIYESWVPWPEGSRIKELRVLQIIPMSVPSGKPPHEVGLREPTSMDSVVLPRYVLGTVPVEPDGSVYLTVPARKEILFQAVDENGLAIQSMRSATYLQPGEMMVCDGCHEQKPVAPPRLGERPLAMHRAPSTLKPDVLGSNPFSYPQLVQPILDKHCVSCHSEEGKAAPILTKEPIKNNWYASYNSLVKDYGFYSYGNPVRTYPEQFGAKSTKLYSLLQKGHYEVKLDAGEMHRLTLWLDCCSIFYGVYEKELGQAQLRGETVLPTLE